MHWDFFLSLTVSALSATGFAILNLHVLKDDTCFDPSSGSVSEVQTGAYSSYNAPFVV